MHIRHFSFQIRGQCAMSSDCDMVRILFNWAVCCDSELLFAVAMVLGS